MSASPTLAEALSVVLDAHRNDMFTMLPCQIVSFNAAKRLATCQPLVLRGYFGETGDRAVEQLPVIPNVPVIFEGSGGARMKYPIKAGHECGVWFASCSLDRWLAVGGIVDPEDDRKHSINDAVCIPGLQSFKNVGDAPTFIEFTDTEIHVGGTQSLALTSALSALYSAIAGAAVLTGDGGATFKANILAALAGWPSGIGTIVTKGS